MLEAYRQICPGAMAIDPLQLYSICYWMISYVDDNTIVVSFKHDTGKTEILNTVQNNLGSRRRLLQLTGGDIDVEKSKWCILSWKYDNRWGEPKIQHRSDFPGEIALNCAKDGKKYKLQLERLEPEEAQRVLGVRLPMDGKMKVE